MKRSQIKKRPISDTTLAHLESELYEYREHDGNGLYFRVKPNGKKSWQLRYKKSDGKWSWLGIGTYPDVSGKLARQKAARLSNTIYQNSLLIKQKISTLTLKQENPNTFECLAYEWLNGKVNHWTKSTMIRHQGALRNHVFPIMGNRSYGDIGPMEWLNFFTTIQTEKKIIEQSNRIYRLCHEIYNLAKITERIHHNPLDGIYKYIHKARATSLAHVPIHELPVLLRDIKHYSEPEIAIALQLLVMLFPRPSELRLARWEQFNLDDHKVWIRPSEYMKKRIEHGIPLPHQAITLLKTLRNYTGHTDFLFPSDIN